jgi:hypothetical protein
MPTMSLYANLERFSVATRQVLVCESLVPQLRAWHTCWARLPYGRPDGLSHEMRYLLAIYRAALAECEAIRAWLVEQRAEMWLAAAEAEAATCWQIEREHLGTDWFLEEDAHLPLSAAA